jgi:two-component system, OmpR family, phosphate regulon sensor histidine kinase PhoR
MIPFLTPLKESIWIRITSLVLATSFVSVCAWILGKQYLPISDVMLALGVGALALGMSVLISKYIAVYAISATDFLSRAILLVTSNDNQVDAPNPELLPKASRAFLQTLAKNVYDLVSGGAENKQANATNQNGGSYFQSLVSSVPLPILVLDNQQTVSYINEQALDYINKKQEDVVGKPVYDVLNLAFVSNVTLDSWIQESVKSRLTATEVWERVRLNFEDGSRKQFDLAAHFSKDDPNKIEIVLTLFDRTRHYERDDHDLTFVSLAVHELRTPLTIMRGYIEVFEDELSEHLNQEQTAFMNNMGASAQQLTAFVANILNVARVEENALFVRMKEENWKEVLVSACKDMELRASVHNKKLTYEIEDNLPTIAVDKVSIYEVVNNLIDNAIKYTHTDETIAIKTYVKDGFIETTITDKGVGVPESLLGHLFDKFYRGHQSKNSVGGTGLGLYLCRAIITAHGGDIWVKSKEGEGSTFGFTLPIYANVADQIKLEDNGEIVRGAHGWIKNHTLYRG